MRYPALNELINKVDNKYSLVLVTAKRARQLVEGEPSLVREVNKNPVSIATSEIAEDKIEFLYK